MTAKTMAEVLVEHQRRNASSCLCGWAKLGHSHPEHQADALTAAGFGDVREAAAKALEDAADRFETRSETLLKTMTNMAGHPDTSPDDVVRYGAYSAEANTTEHWLRARAASVRGEG